jgi:hypothetical protein
VAFIQRGVAAVAVEDVEPRDYGGDCCIVLAASWDVIELNNQGCLMHL